MNRSHSPKSAVPATDTVTHATEATHSPASAEYAASLQAVTPELLAMPPEQLLPINVDLAMVCTMVSGRLPELLAMRPQFEPMPDLDLALIDSLPVYLRATAFAHASHTYSLQTASPLPELAAKCAAAFAVLEHGTQVFIDQGLLDPMTLSVYGKERGNRPCALETLHLAALLRAHWPALSAHPVLAVAALEAAEHAGSTLFEAIGERERLENAVDDATLLRQRAFSRFARAYDELRRAVSYLRWHHDDVDTLAPSLYVGSNNGGSHAAAAPSAKASPAEPSAPAEPQTNSTLEALTKGPGSRPVPQDDPFKR